ncbi:MAG: U32 family peptidase [Clostridia bacterium]|nr:U32 family peptidase [Clostridia bacterium]
MTTPEILSPAGNEEKMQAALRYGADAVYLAGKAYGMRASTDNFTPDEMRRAVAWAHEKNKKVYVTVNTLPREDELPALCAYLGDLGEIAPDALIVADLGVFEMAKKYAPRVPLHVSTQAGCVNSASVNFWYGMGARRVILARELSLSEIRAIRRATPPDVELEVFVHGSMCVSFSGRCLLSNYLTGRDGNRGQCAQPCRWNYALRAYALEEEKRPGSFLPVEEHGGETFVMSSRDLCMIGHMEDLLEAGVSSCKIEGRAKSACYAAVTANAYRLAADAAAAGRPFDPALLREVESVSHRTYDTGYFYADPRRDAETVAADGYLREKAWLATVLDYDPASGTALCRQRNKYIAGQPLEVLTPGRTGVAVTPSALTDPDGAPIDSTPHPGMLFRLALPIPVMPGDLLREADD